MMKLLVSFVCSVWDVCRGVCGGVYVTEFRMMVLMPSGRGQSLEVDYVYVSRNGLETALMKLLFSNVWDS